MNKQKNYFNANVVKKYNLKTNYASVSAISKIFNAQQNDQLKMTPRLGESNFNPSHFQKINVMTSSSIISVDVAATFSKPVVVMIHTRQHHGLFEYYDSGSIK